MPIVYDALLWVHLLWPKNSRFAKVDESGVGWMLILLMVLYALGLLHSANGFYRKRQIFVTLALCMVVCGFAAQTFYLVQLGLELRHLPITNLSESLSFFTWCITLTFICASRYEAEYDKMAGK